MPAYLNYKELRAIQDCIYCITLRCTRDRKAIIFEPDSLHIKQYSNYHSQSSEMQSEWKQIRQEMGLHRGQSRAGRTGGPAQELQAHELDILTAIVLVEIQVILVLSHAPIRSMYEPHHHQPYYHHKIHFIKMSRLTLLILLSKASPSAVCIHRQLQTLVYGPDDQRPLGNL